MRVAKKHGGAAVVSNSDAGAVVALSRQIAADSALSRKLSDEAMQLHQTLFNPDRLQDVFVQKITELVNGRCALPDCKLGRTGRLARDRDRVERGEGQGEG